MRILADRIHLSPSDLANYAACAHLTSLDLAAARGDIHEPAAFSSVTHALRRRGEAHEAAYVESLKAAGFTLVDLRDCALDHDGVSQTLAAMKGGAQRIVQAPLVHDRWAGRADVLVRVETSSALGSWSYEPLDTKLARETRGSAMLQLCAYAAVLQELQGAAPDVVHVVSPGDPFSTHSYRLAEYAAYFRLLRARLLDRLHNDADGRTYPDPVAHCDLCRWSGHCDAQRRRDDHLSLVAGIRKLQAAQLQTWQVTTLAGLARLPLPLQQRPDRGSADALVRAREQARVQLEGRLRGTPVHEVLPVQPNIGLSALPEPSPGDVFFDIEGDPFVPRDGREYLFGWACPDDSGQPLYHRAWALTAADEKAAFERFVDFVVERRRRFPGMHVYHYAPYEPSALKRLMGRYATREDEVDGLLRGESFVDLYAVVRHAVRASVDRYSIKSLEVFYQFARSIVLTEAGVHLRTVEAALESNDTRAITPETLAGVEAYNRDDCVSALHLRAWLESLRTAIITTGTTVPRPAPPEPRTDERMKEREARVRALMDRLTQGVPIEPAARSAEAHGRWLLAQMLEFHRREDKAAWWDFFRLADLAREDYADEPNAIAGLEFAETVGGTAACPVDRYRYPRQELRRPGGTVHAGKNQKLGTVEATDLEARTIDIKKTQRTSAIHPSHVFFFEYIRPDPIPAALFDVGAAVADAGFDASPRHGAIHQLLLRKPPRLEGDTPWHVPGEDLVARGCRLARALDRTVLPVQGPPGAGKTFLGAHMICALVAAGATVGVTGPSHKVIRNLLDTIQTVAATRSECVRCVQKVSGDPDCDEYPLKECAANDDVLDALESGEATVAAGTAWLWSRQDFEGSVDVLVVDEAGQVSLANVVAMGRSAKSIVLLGDPQQLEQPLQGSHPEGTAVSALQHLLGEAKTMPFERGLFLPETWRLAPEVCRFTSEMFYDARLTSRRGLEIQQLVSPAGLNGSGLWYVPVTHAGNQNESREEVEVVARLVDTLRGEHRWINQTGVEAGLDWSDILIVAPYNAQVSAIQDALPHARVGTVDRFQGQEAAVVIYSATTSAAEEAPRGMEFLYSLNRLNVASSRARGAVILVASPLLFEPDCQTPRQMQLANALCRYAELARDVDFL